MNKNIEVIAMADSAVFSYSRNAKKEGVLSLVMLFCLIMILLVVSAWVPESTESNTFWIVSGFFCLGGLFLLFFHVIPNLISKDEFRFEIYHDRIVCIRPDTWNKTKSANKINDDYVVEIEQIRYLVERDNPLSDTTPLDAWRLATVDCKEYVIPNAYGNPIHRIIKEIRKLKPGIEILKIPYCDIE